MTVTLGEVEVVGSTTPRLWTPPLVTGPPGPCGCGCALTPETSYGFREVEFAERRLGRPKWPWQRWLSIHAGELRPDGIPRFRRLVVVVGRQSGKTREVEDLTLFWIFEEKHPSILGTSTLAKYAKKPWMSAFNLAVRRLPDRLPENPHRRAIRKTTGEEEWWSADDCHYGIAASNAEGGRSMSNRRVIADEFAKQYNYDAYGAAYYSMDAFEDAQYWALTTPDPKGVPFNDLRAAALAFIESGEGDPSLGLFEWSAPEDADPTDVRALAQSNPTLGLAGGKSAVRLLNDARAAAASAEAGDGDLLRTFKTEVMCIQQTDSVNLAIDPAAWRDCRVPAPVDTELRQRLAACVDLSLDGQHATLAVAVVLDDERVRVETVHEWSGPDAASQLERELPAWAERVRPKVLGWFPSGPAAAVAAKVADRRKDGARGWPPRGVQVEGIRGEVTATAMGFAKEVTARTVVHSGQEMLDAQVAKAEKLTQGGGWVFTRKAGQVDAVYAVAGAVHLARTLPKVRKVSRRSRMA
ncbi:MULTISPECIES: terminase [unclassified Micromonospora]|uniref:terminase n=1 Tax=Micromonospora sp. 15K316 TaxID=2530376 RepID=UPI001FB77D6C|nr:MULTISPECIES: terminase [unclassified Micromonospora]